MPISVSYDRPAEEGALVTELSGIPKEKESLASLLAAAGSLAVGGNRRKSKRGRYVIGADVMRVGEIVTLERFLAVRNAVNPRCHEPRPGASSMQCTCCFGNLQEPVMCCACILS